ncbi:terminase gpP N-terminus-related DNA-binding protein [Rosettibacter firmus]|uniref:terminase gpP N-terminus-related DNA-binding protein n=1 Tax=Rosettibacter firmus TaxID=3111522 RepID=UPI00336C2559
MKNAALYEEAKRLYVNEGFSIDAIVELLKNHVSRKTLYNWKVANNWDDQRKAYQQENEDLQKEIKEIARIAIKEAKANPTPHNIYAVVKALSALKLMQGIQIIEDGNEEKVKNISKDTIEFIQKEILGL